ncbi:DUF2721 domain-containing protein [Reyranella soli]|uniref:DUF2721 domain-containing protein n=1 Tax=Reyranella soli TaxID=1230389 RepID=UPI001C3F584C
MRDGGSYRWTGPPYPDCTYTGVFTDRYRRLARVFNARIVRVADHITHVTGLLDGGANFDERARLQAHLLRLAQRASMLDAAVALGAIGGCLTCSAALVLFLGSVSQAGGDSWLIGLFAVALSCTVASLVAFFADSLLAWHGLRREGPLPRAVRND